MADFEVDDSFFELEQGVDYSNSEITNKIYQNKFRNVIIVDWQLPLFSSLHNPNKPIFVIETQAGADDDDRGHGSIGDATMEHVSKMSHRLPEMESFFMMPNGNLFRTVPNVQPFDEDGERYNKRQMMQAMMSSDKSVTSEDKQNVINFLREEIEERKADREEKQDAMDQVVIPYEQWEAMPQMTRDWDVPATQAPIYVYAGNTSLPFYDFLPEDHPDKDKLIQFILTVNSVDWDKYNSYTHENMVKWILGQHWEIPTVMHHLTDFSFSVSTSEDNQSPDEMMISTLADIESDWVDLLRSDVIDAFEESPVTREMEKFEEELSLKYSKGQLVWAEISNFGKKLYTKYGNTVTTAHWKKYKKMKARFAPLIRVGKVNLNLAGYKEIRSVIADKNKADYVFFHRPFMRLEELVKKSALELSDVGYTKGNVVFISQIKSTAKKAKTLKMPSILGKLAQQIIQTQKSKPDMMTDEEWSAVWQTYRIAKAEIKSSLGLNY